MACSFLPDESCCPRTRSIELSNTVKYKINNRLGARGISTGGFCKDCLILLKASSRSSFHFHGLFFCKSLKIGSHVGVKCEINLDT